MKTSIAWEAIEDRCTRPVVTTAAGTAYFKEKSKYTVAERMTAHEYLQTLDVIFYGVDLAQLKVVLVCEFAKEA